MLLVFCVQSSIHDKIQNIADFSSQVHIFNPMDFPDAPSGSLIEKFISVGVRTFIRIKAMTLYTATEAIKYSVDKVTTRLTEFLLKLAFTYKTFVYFQRNCVFESEINTIFGGYSFSDCVMDCRIKSIVALCKCIPFSLNMLFDGMEDVPQCNLADLRCLSKYKGIPKYVTP